MPFPQILVTSYNIKNLILNKEYSAVSEKVIIKKSKQGINVNLDVINKVRSISKLEKIKSYFEYYEKFCETLKLKKGDQVIWKNYIGDSKNQTYLKYLKSNLEYSEKLITNYHTAIYPSRVNVYKNLQPVCLDGEQLKIPVYNHQSVTGRTSILSGFNFLTLSKEKKKKLKSTKQDETLIEIDVKSCEPSFYLKSMGYEIDEDDVYLYIAKNMSINISDRSRFKRGILSILYGANKKTSKHILKCDFKTIDKIRRFFKIEEFEGYLRKQFDKNGLIYNYYGRPICFNHNLVNYWIQSSSVDYCSLGFANLINHYDLKPCFFVHDSMTVSANKKCLNSIRDANLLCDPISNFKIPIEVTKLQA